MPNLHDIERRISSVTSTKQITRTMEMVAAAKIRRATARMEQSVPWACALSDVLLSTVRNSALSVEPLLQKRAETKRCALVVVTSDRGLAGGFNSNVLRAAEKLMRQKERQGIEVEVVSCGKKGTGYFEYRGISPVLSIQNHSADPLPEDAARVAAYVSEGYRTGRLDEVVVVFNHAKNSAEQRLITETVLPVPDERFVEVLGLAQAQDDQSSDGTAGGERFEFEPSADEALGYLAASYLNTAVHFALVDSAAAEQGARRAAMKSATDNATEMAETLTRLYNRERQGAITTEINEIVGGAAALED
ncbi:ATP synthase F1 subunit gamma [Eggerthellaceae bacterium zg-1084]|uniref:ATP synthase gamma chain n=1 Tax=Berryella wangjianweii TaxID=2734634 RepID=A0A6M8J7L3_9ACTN|nr:ATP synthase F1 subunit gamma [Berryella wangjianweii]NPD30789.1 ATP synthase F1 subunit gamma [Berryella wangjianweii]NPD31992.1 ATP synthase F1 subunit gamma [Eggerthellaceae bacterium zg-997]QKF07419.1 ATP synthase F1 subunit gamma [Berryella wangjianweii]